MNISRRTTVIVLFLGLFLVLGILVRSFILENVVKPFALVLWAIWRILLSVDQKYYWGLLIFSAMFYLFYRLSREPAVFKQSHQSNFNATLETVSYWRNSILFTSDEIDQANVLKRSLGDMLATLYAAKQPGTASFEIYAALKRRHLPLPEEIYDFLFPSELSGSVGPLKQVLLKIRQTPGKWMRRWTRRDLAEYYRSIDEVITFMETSMEIEHDQGHIETHNN